MPLIHEYALVIHFPPYFCKQAFLMLIFFNPLFYFLYFFLGFFPLPVPALSRAAHILCWGTGKCFSACRCDVSVFGSQQQYRKCHHPDKES